MRNQHGGDMKHFPFPTVIKSHRHTCQSLTCVSSVQRMGSGDHTVKMFQ